VPRQQNQDVDGPHCCAWSLTGCHRNTVTQVQPHSATTWRSRAARLNSERRVGDRWNGLWLRDAVDLMHRESTATQSFHMRPPGWSTQLGTKNPMATDWEVPSRLTKRQYSNVVFVTAWLESAVSESRSTLVLNNRSASLARKQRNTGGGTSCDTNAYIAIGWPTMFATVLHVTEASQKVMNATCGPYPWHDTTARPLYLQVRKSPGIRDESLQALTVRALLEQRSPMASRIGVVIPALTPCLASSQCGKCRVLKKMHRDEERLEIQASHAQIPGASQPGIYWFSLNWPSSWNNNPFVSRVASYGGLVIQASF